MKISELNSALARIQQVVGDIPIVFQKVEEDAQTVLHTIGVELDPASGDAAGTVTLNHGPAPDPQPEPAPDIPSAELAPVVG